MRVEQHGRVEHRSAESPSRAGVGNVSERTFAGLVSRKPSERALARGCPQLSGVRGLTCAKTDAPLGGTCLGVRIRGRSSPMMTRRDLGVARTWHQAVMVHLMVDHPTRSCTAFGVDKRPTPPTVKPWSAPMQGESA